MAYTFTRCVRFLPPFILDNTPLDRKATGGIQRPVDFYPLPLRFFITRLRTRERNFRWLFFLFSLILHIIIPYILGILFTV